MSYASSSPEPHSPCYNLSPFCLPDYPYSSSSYDPENPGYGLLLSPNYNLLSPAYMASPDRLSSRSRSSSNSSSRSPSRSPRYARFAAENDRANSPESDYSPSPSRSGSSMGSRHSYHSRSPTPGNGTPPNIRSPSPVHSPSFDDDYSDESYSDYGSNNEVNDEDNENRDDEVSDSPHALRYRFFRPSRSSEEDNEAEKNRWAVRSTKESENQGGAKMSDEFSSNQRFQFNIMRKQKMLTDVVLKAEDQSFACHKLILAASSNYFERMFMSTMKETQTNEVTLEVLQEKTLGMILDYMYTACIHLTWSNISSVLVAADYLQMDGLKKDGSRFLLKHLSADTVLYIYQLAKECNMQIVKQKAWKKICKDFCNVVYSEDFVKLSVDELIEILNCDRLNIDCEDPVLSGVLKWVYHDISARKTEFLDALFPLVRLSFCTKYYLCSLIETEDMFSSEECQTRLAKALARASSASKQWQEDLDKPRKHFICGRTSLVLYGGIGEGTYASDRANKTMWYLDDRHSDPSKIRWRQVYLDSYDPPPYHKYSSSCLQYKYSLCQIPDGIFLSGGTQIDSYFGSHYRASIRAAIYQFSTAAWGELSSMPGQRRYHTSVYINDKVYVIGGYGLNKTPTKEVYYFSLCDSQWSHLREDLPVAVKYPTAVALGMCIYVFGGYEERKQLNTSTDNTNEETQPNGTYSSHTQVFDTSLYRWRRAANMPKTPENPASVAFRDSVYVVGGIRQPVCMSYNPRLDTWTVLAEPMFHHSHGAAVLYKGMIMLCGGAFWADGQIGIHNQIECYDVEANEWTKSEIPALTRLPKPLAHISIMSAYYKDVHLTY